MQVVGRQPEKEELLISENIFKVNQRITVMLSKQPNAKQFHSRIEEVASEYLVIAMPMSQGQPVILVPGTKFIVKLADSSAVYMFTSRYIDKRNQPVPMWVISLPAAVEKIQQRSFVRIDVMLPMELTLLPVVDGEEAGEQQARPVKAATKDLGGGGARLIVTEPLQTGAKIELAFEIPEQGLIRTMAEVIRVEKPADDRQLFWIGVEFLNLAEPTRNKIIKFIFKKQMELRQKGI